LETLWGDPLGPKFNGSFDQKSTGYDAMQSVASMAGAKVVNNGQLLNVVPDRVQQVRHALFTTANIVRDSLQIIYTFDAVGDFTGNVLEYRDPDSFEARYVYAPERTNNPEAFTLFGCTDETYAQEMANYLWNVKTTRRKAIKFDTELEGLIPSFGQRIGISHTMPDWGQSGVFVESIDALTWIVDQPLDWDENETNVIVIRTDTGLPTSPYTVTKGANPNIVVFSEVPTISNQDGREPTSYVFGVGEEIITDAIVTKISPAGENIVTIEAQVYDERIYEDAPWQMKPAPAPRGDLYVGGNEWEGYDYQRPLIGDGGLDDGIWVINPIGYYQAYVSHDFGANWEIFRFTSTNDPNNLYHGFTKLGVNNEGKRELIIAEYENGNRDFRAKYAVYDGPGSLDLTWTQITSNIFAYQHGFAARLSNAIYYADGNNNGDDNFHRVDQFPDNTTKTVGATQIPNTSTTSGFHVHDLGNDFIYVFGNQGGPVDSYAVVDALSLTSSGATQVDVLYRGTTSASDGTKIFSSGHVADGAITGPLVRVQELTIFGLGTENNITFPEDVEWARVHYENQMFIVTARSLADTSKIYYHFGVSGTANSDNYITTTYSTTSDIRELRYLASGSWLFAYLGDVGGTPNTYVLSEVTL
jgi:hypothetical protein